jgi:hypothetical protein
LVETAPAASDIVSVPALAASLRGWRIRDPFSPVDGALEIHALAPMYRLSAGTVVEETHAATQVAGEVAERLRRLTRAYGEWRVFEPGPYFDLSPAQVSLLTRVVERASTVHVVFFVDALLPAFQAVQRYAAQVAMATGSAEQDETIHATLTGHWRRMLDVIEAARTHLSDDISFLAFSGAAEEQERWMRSQRSGRIDPVAPWSSLERSAVPTLTLSVDFPMPAFRQPGRKRRLLRMWQRLYGQTQDHNMR